MFFSVVFLVGRLLSRAVLRTLACGDVLRSDHLFKGNQNLMVTFGRDPEEDELPRPDGPEGKGWAPLGAVWGWPKSAPLVVLLIII